MLRPNPKINKKRHNYTSLSTGLYHVSSPSHATVKKLKSSKTKKRSSSGREHRKPSPSLSRASPSHDAAASSAIPANMVSALAAVIVSVEPAIYVVSETSAPEIPSADVLSTSPIRTSFINVTNDPIVPLEFSRDRAVVDLTGPDVELATDPLVPNADNFNTASSVSASLQLEIGKLSILQDTSLIPGFESTIDTSFTLIDKLCWAAATNVDSAKEELNRTKME